MKLNRVKQKVVKELFKSDEKEIKKKLSGNKSINFKVQMYIWEYVRIKKYKRK